MKQKKHNIFHFLSVACILFFPFAAYSQFVPEMEPEDIVYTRIDSFTALSIANPDTVFVSDTEGFAEGDTVLFYETIGSTLRPENTGEVESVFYSGKYALMKIEEIYGDSAIVFNSRLPYMIHPLSGKVNKMQPGEVAQLLKIPSYRQVRLTPGFYDKSDYWAWDPQEKTGGVFVVLTGKLILETDFSADGQGFKGAVPDMDFQGVCSSSSGDTIYERTGNFTAMADSSGKKGESYHVRSYPFEKGFENAAGAGGGGNGKYSGGGGGAGNGSGARGGFESAECGEEIGIGGKGGFGLGFNNDVNSFTYNRVYLGSGGGTGTQNSEQGRNATAGGNGGGILIILADTLIGNGYTIRANGQDVIAEATAGGGGGGGGGVIIADLGYVENASFEAKGGKGGDIASVSERTGPGGGGGGGLIAWNDNILSGFSTDVSRGQNGEYRGRTYNGFEIAGNGEKRDNVNIPIMGFIINPLSDDQIICENDVPEKFMAAKPKGGNGSFSYQWFKAEDIHPDSFVAIPGATEMTYQYPFPLTKTTYFKRRVTSGDDMDETFFITVDVIPRITNNQIATDQTICYLMQPEELSGTNEPDLSGGLGAGSYSFSWFVRTDQEEWAEIGDADMPGFAPGALTDTSFFRRMVTSGVCNSISDSVKITVLPPVMGNTPETSQSAYCNNQQIQPINSGTLSGGDETYSYQWEIKTGDEDWREDVTTAEFPPRALSADDTGIQIYTFRRIVSSGENDVCVDTSQEVILRVLPDIDNNVITPDQDTLCANLPSITIHGTQPVGGDGQAYSYLWQYSTDGMSSWSTREGENQLIDYQPGILMSDIYFRRKVQDAQFGVCTSYSNVRKIDVLPEIKNNLIGDIQSQCVGVTPGLISGTPPQGGDGNYRFLWQSKTGDEGFWTDTEGNENNFTPDVPEEGNLYYYRRIVSSGENNTCSDTSLYSLLQVEDQISDNMAEKSHLEVCFESDILIDATPAMGGDGMTPSYQWQDSTLGHGWQVVAGNSISEDYQSMQMNNTTWFRRIAVSKSGLCSSVSPVIMVDTLTLPYLRQFSLSDDTICDDIPLTINLDIESSYYGPFNVIYTNGSQTDTAFNVSDSIYFPRYEKPFQGFNFRILGVEDRNQCKAKGEFSGSHPLWVNDAPSPLIAAESHVLELCGPVFSLTGNPDRNPGVSDSWWEVSSGSDMMISDPGSLSPEFSIELPFNQYSDTVRFLQSTAKCGSRADTVFVKLYEQPETPVIYRGDHAILFIRDEDTISASSPSAGTFVWDISQGGGTILNPLDNPVLISDVPLYEESILNYTVRNGVCQPVSANIVLERKDVHVYEGISPEKEDGQNDYLVAEGLDVEEAEFTLQIFSTQGLLVREISDKDISSLGFRTGLPHDGLELWDGRNKNGTGYVPDGTYYYVLIINYKDVEFVKKGFVLVR